MTTTHEGPVTPQQYIARERAVRYRSEYFGGEVVAMGGASKEHVRIVTNLVLAFGNRFGEGPCEVFANDMRVSLDFADAYVYPDIAVVCAKPLFVDDAFDTLLNPTLVVEVLSPGTERHDRERKAPAYWTLESLREYVLIAQDRPRVEVYRRGQESRWPSIVHEALDEDVRLESVGCTIPLAEIYRRVFPPREYPSPPYPAPRPRRRG